MIGVETDDNRLSEALSPYLLQHKDNPVHWREWSAGTLEEARQQGKPIFLSIGYAACHWCHVMAHESFEDEETARLMNALFINVKVDREERPDIDQIYMTALQALGVQGGWPLSMFLTPAGEPFYGGTYFPKERAYGRPSFRDVLTSVARAYHEDPTLIRRNSDAIIEALTHYLGTAKGAEASGFTEADFDRYIGESVSSLDQEHGGVGRQPKFPTMPLWESLWRHALVRNDSASRDAAIRWLVSLCQGGIYDHLGGGFARYTVDRAWLVPHFEKMLYDNAQILRGLALALPHQPGSLFRDRIEETIGFLSRDMLTPDGALAASFDADSEGEEGRFYVWTPEELQDLPSLFRTVYDAGRDGNWEGKVILNRLSYPYPLPDDDEATLAAVRAALFEQRSARVPPARDAKILTDWNGLAIRALAECSFACDRPDWLALAESVYRSVSESAVEGRLPHARRGQKSSFPGFLSDYAAMANAAISLYALTGKDIYRSGSAEWLAVAVRDFADGEGSYAFTPQGGHDLLLRAYQDRDEATPAASGQLLEAMHRHALLFDDIDMLARAEELGQRLWSRLSEQPHGAAAVMNGLLLGAEPCKLILPVDRPDLVAVARSLPDPARIDVLLRGTEPDGVLPPEAREAAPGSALLCTGRICLPPTTDPEMLRALLAP